MEVECGDLLRGGKRFSSNGVEEWFPYPSYKVIALHMNGEIMFMETLNSKGESEGRIHQMKITSDQWQHWNDEE